MTIKKKIVSPRQKMINLMYVVLMAMLAINVSREVLDKVLLVEENLNADILLTAEDSRNILASILEEKNKNEEKAGRWAVQAEEIAKETETVCVIIDSLKTEIKGRGVGKREEMKAAEKVMVKEGGGEILRRKLVDFSLFLSKQSELENVREYASKSLRLKKKDGGEWERDLFVRTPVIVAVTILAELEQDVRNTENYALKEIMGAIGGHDQRMNRLQAVVVPEKDIVLQGEEYKATVMLAAMDTTQQPELYVDGKKVDTKDYVVRRRCSSIGQGKLNGFLQLKDYTGKLLRKDFSRDYLVIPPVAVAGNDLMNVLYAGYNNPVSVSVPGVPAEKISVEAKGGTIRETAEKGKYIVRPTNMNGTVTLKILLRENGGTRTVAENNFRVRELPMPRPMLKIKGENEPFRGGKIKREKITESGQLTAAIDDGMLNVPFQVKSFQMVTFDNMGNAVPVASEQERFSTRQKELIRVMPRNRRLYITRVMATGPDGKTRILNTPLEIIIQ